MDSKAEGRRARAGPEKNFTRNLFEGESINLAKSYEGAPLRIKLRRIKFHPRFERGRPTGAEQY